MKYRIHGHRHAEHLFPNLDEYEACWHEIEDALSSITEEMIIEEFEGSKRKAKSISEAVNVLIKRELVKRGWNPESYIFADDAYRGSGNAKGTWRLDFAKGSLSVEVAFNHRSDIAWNLIKPTLASELNHVEKAIQTSGGVIVTATRDMKAAGGFDNAVGTYEDYVQYLKPMRGMLSAPLVVIGLEAPESFEVSVTANPQGKKEGAITRYALVTISGDVACPACGCLLSSMRGTCESCGCAIAPRPNA